MENNEELFNEDPLFNVHNTFEKRYLDVYEKYFAEPSFITDNYIINSEIYDQMLDKFRQNLWNGLLKVMKLSANDSRIILYDVFSNHFVTSYEGQYVHDIIEDVIKHENFVLKLELYKHIKGE